MATRTRRSRLLSATLVVLFVAACGSALADDAAVTAAAPSTVACTDVGVQLRMQRSPAMPLEELSELHTGRSCATTTIMATIADSVASALDQAALDVVDCVSTRIDEELLGLFAVMRVCNRPTEPAGDPMVLAAWDAFIRPKLQHLFQRSGAATRGQQPARLEYYQSTVECEQMAMPSSYTLRVPQRSTDETEDVPRFRFKSTELWSDPAPSSKDHSLVVLKLKVKNDGTAPLHVFAAAVKLLDEAPSNGLLVLAPGKVEPILPSSEVSVVFQVEVPHLVELPSGANFLVYFAHTSTRAHILEGRLDGKKLVVANDLKRKKKSPTKPQSDLLGVHKFDGSASLESAYPSLPLGVWQMISMAIVLVVAAVTTAYMRRKWMRVHWPHWLDCLTTSNKLKHKTSNLAKMTEMTQKKPAYEPANSDDADMDALESDGFLPTSSMEAASPPRKKPMAKLREKMPAIRMQWKKPEILRDKLSVRRALALDATARIDPKQFELLWEQFIERHNSSFSASKQPTVETVIQLMATAGISCMASGTVNGVEKYVLYAKQRGTSDYFFVSVDVDLSSREATVSIRTSKDTHDSLVEQFIALVEKQLALLLLK